jgi:hypothetical protein
MSKFVRLASVAGITAGLLAGGATAALAGTPTPSPVVTPHFVVQPTSPERFSVTLLHVTLPAPLPAVNVNHVSATGPVSFTNATDTQITNVLDKFTQGANSVNVRHTPLNLPVVNRATCTVTINQTGVWRFAGGTGVDLHAAGVGLFRLNAVLHFQNRQIGRFSFCPISGNPYVIQRELNSGIGLPAPQLSLINVTGVGRASV